MVFRFAQQSQCLSRQVGAILVKDNYILGEGWNSAPRGSTTNSCPRSNCSKTKKCKVEGKDLTQAICTHAEANAIGYCAAEGRATKGSILYSTTKPCAECAKLIVAAQIIKVIYYEDYPTPLTDRIFENADIKVIDRSWNTQIWKIADGQ